MPIRDERAIALETIAADLNRLIRQANAHQLSLLAYLLDMAATHAREELATMSSIERSTVAKLFPKH
jgi:hypothetical protein